MNENDGSSQDVPIDSRFDDELGRFSTEAARRVMHSDADLEWEHVRSDHLDPAHPLDDLSRAVVIEGARGTVENVKELESQKKTIDKLQEEARIDEKTGLRTFGVFKDDLPRAIALAQREHAVIALWQVDGKGLKKVNDNISRPAGDAYIVAIAKALEASVRRSDGVYRGGKESDEFFILMPSLHETEQEISGFFAQKTEDMRTMLEKFARDEPELAKAVDHDWIGLSIGVTYHNFGEPAVHQSAHELSDVLLADADREMRFDKRKKRIDARKELQSKGQDVPEDDRLY